MNIKQALKEKNKLVKRNSELFQKFDNYNSVEAESLRPYDPKESLENWLKGINELATLKAAIHKANIEVYEKIFRLSELKSAVSLLRRVDCKEGKHSASRMSDRVVIYDSAVTLVERDNLIENLEREIESIQEELDNHNSRQTI